jgi:hypothetical protein
LQAVAAREHISVTDLITKGLYCAFHTNNTRAWKPLIPVPKAVTKKGSKEHQIKVSIKTRGQELRYARIRATCTTDEEAVRKIARLMLFGSSR